MSSYGVADASAPGIGVGSGWSSGNATVAELQIYYLQKDASSWVKNSTDALDIADGENRKQVEERQNSDQTAATWTILISLLFTIAALSVGAVIAYRSAKSITEPLTNLMNVARGIGNTGDLEHNIDTSRTDEIGELARTFHKMVTYLKEMAAVSEAIAGGDLTLEVRPRSSHDTLGNAFARLFARLFADWGVILLDPSDSELHAIAGSPHPEGFLMVYLPKEKLLIEAPLELMASGAVAAIFPSRPRMDRTSRWLRCPGIDPMRRVPMSASANCSSGRPTS